MIAALRFTCLVLALIALSSCGGGGGGSTAASGPGGDVGSDGTPRYHISGTVVLPDTAAVDSDTNDPDQAGWASNNTNATAQAISTPVQLAGYLNMPGKGPAGKNFAAGDAQDIFKVSLVAGQVIELVFASNTDDNDIDLLMFDVSSPTAAVPVGASSSSSGNRECIAVTRSGNYFVMPWIVKGAAMYTLHISGVGEGASCSNGMSSTALFVPGELVAKDAPKAAGLPENFGGFAVQSTSNDAPRLLNVPASATLTTRDTGEPRDADIAQALGTLRYAKELQSTGNYKYVEPNYRLERFSTYAPTDPQYSTQLWNYAQINLPDAMDHINALGITNQRPIVAVVDNGVMTTHPDLQPQIVSGYFFVGGAGPGGDDPRTAGQCMTGGLDPCGHGTLVSGIIAAVANNGQYGAGAAPMALIMPVREDDTSFSQVQAIRYAAGLSNISGTLPARKADVINMSWGTGTACSQQFADTFAEARANGVILVAAGGNTAPTKQTPPGVASPANCPGVISVGALDSAKNRATYSAYGPQMTLVGPGGDETARIYSTASTFSSFTTLAPSFQSSYGTSFSAPHVAAVMALMRYVAPAITPEQIDTLIATGRLTDDLGVPGRDDEFGYGLINAAKAVNEAAALAAGGSIPGAIVARPASLAFGSTVSSATLRLDLTAASSEIVTGITSSSPAITISPASGVNPITKLGDYTIAVDRSKLPLGFSYPVVTVTTSVRTFTVVVSATRLSVSISPSATVGAVWVRATNMVTSTSYLQRVNVSGGRYAFNLSGMRGGTYNVRASTDLDNDGNFCEPGEACGEYPGNGALLEINSNMSGLEFSIAPNLSTAAPP